MTAPEPRANPLLLGQEAAEATLVEALHSARLHHAWLLTGPPGIGKATLAFRFARRLLAGPTRADTLALPETHPTFRRVAAGAHADLLTIEREWDPKRKRLRGEIVVDDVRRIAAFLHLTPAEGGWRVVVLDGAEDLNRNAANALLKVLEEPPPRALLLLACNAAGRLLPTIRSRTRRLRLAALDEATVDTLLGHYAPEVAPAERARLAALAEGSIGRALLLAAGGAVQVAELVGKVLAALPALPPQRGYEVADTLGRDEDAFGTFMDLLRATLAAAVRAAARGRADPDQTRLLGARPLAAWIDVWQGLTALQDETEHFHLDKRQALVAGFGLLAGR
ncbi:MAG TPA: DNA polymerase III subunit delta' [Acetobacteraceae bacterium]|nr:DNA polymerase III subunit delta' [Acetobacteraceae bacterium]